MIIEISTRGYFSHPWRENDQFVDLLMHVLTMSGLVDIKRGNDILRDVKIDIKKFLQRPFGLFTVNNVYLQIKG